MKWGEVFTIGTPIIVAILGLAGVIWGKNLSKRTDLANARKAESEAARTDVETAKLLMEELRGMYDNQKKVTEEQRVDYEKRLSSTRGELGLLADWVKTVEVRQAALITALAAHAPWDFAAYEALKASFDNYPPPPPLDPEPIVSLRNVGREDRRRRRVYEEANDGVDDTYGM